jgi:NADPH:quinone reductase-like Zn-dependent oxidoreductase
VVSSFNRPPRYEDVVLPAPAGEDEIVVDVLAAGLHPRVRSQANGSHYTGTDKLPLVPGIDGVGRGADGVLRYFVLPDTTMGALAEQTIIDVRRSVALPEDSDSIAVAAAMNPAMSSWVALRRRIEFRPGQNVLVLGATGNAGRLAVQVARRLGADQILAAGRNPARLAGLSALGATETVLLDDDRSATAGRLGRVTAEVDIVVDYLWGSPTAEAMLAVITARVDHARPLTWIEVGSVAGSTASIPSAALRAARLQIVGSGQGSVTVRDFLAELPELAREITNGTFDVDARPLPLREVEQAWTAPAATTERIVFIPPG